MFGSEGRRDSAGALQRRCALQGRACLGKKPFAGEADSAFLALLGGGTTSCAAPGWGVLGLCPELGAVTRNPTFAAAANNAWKLLFEGSVLRGGCPKNAFGEHVPLDPGLFVVVPDNGGGGESNTLGPGAPGGLGDKLEGVDLPFEDSGQSQGIIGGGGGVGCGVVLCAGRTVGRSRAKAGAGAGSAARVASVVASRDQQAALSAL